MNFLAHAALSGPSAETLAGNMMGDYIRKAQEKNYPPAIIQGVWLHREIDRYTDTHPLVRECRKIFFPHIRHYALVISDVLYDHFLGDTWNTYYSGSLEDFAAETYRKVDMFRDLHPPMFSYIFQRMRDHNWLPQYRDREYLYASFHGLQRRSPGFIHAETTKEIIEKNYTTLAGNFRAFYPGLMQRCEEFRKNME